MQLTDNYIFQTTCPQCESVGMDDFEALPGGGRGRCSACGHGYLFVVATTEGILVLAYQDLGEEPWIEWRAP